MQIFLLGKESRLLVHGLEPVKSLLDWIDEKFGSLVGAKGELTINVGQVKAR
jgi:hypothetical protein